MDEQIERLSRAARAAPDDPAAARALDAALLRAGQADAVRARYRFKFLCPVAWEDMEPADAPERRHCQRCRRAVQFVRSPDELAASVAARACVALLRDELEGALAGLVADPRLHSAAQPGAACLVGAAEDPLELNYLLLGVVAEEPPEWPLTPGEEGAPPGR